MSAELGVGIVYFQALAPLVEQPGAVDVVEVEPQVFWLPSDGEERYRDGGAPLRWLAGLPVPKIAHGVGAPIGGAAPPEARAVERFARDAATLGAVWASEHLSFNRADGEDGRFDAGFLLPPRQTRAAALAIAGHARRFAAQLPVPFAIETGVNYLRPRSDELSDGRFVATVAEQADCGILLDLHNAWTNERNGRQPLEAFLQELPLDRVVEVHLAGGEWHRGYWLDAHAGLVQDELIAIARRVLPELPSLRAVMFELLADHVPRVGFPAIRDQIDALRRLWDARHAARARRPAGMQRAVGEEPGRPPDRDSAQAGEAMEVSGEAMLLGDAAQWDAALGALAIGREPSGPFAAELAADPGIAVLRELVDAQRAGAAVDSLRLTTRLMRLTLGSEALRDELQAFWASTPPSPFGAEEGAALGAFLAGRRLAVPHLAEVLAFERALLRIHRGGAGEVVRFRCDPAQLLGALANHRLPEALRAADVALALSPDGTVAPVPPGSEDGAADRR